MLHNLYRAAGYNSSLDLSGECDCRRQFTHFDIDEVLRVSLKAGIVQRLATTALRARKLRALLRCRNRHCVGTPYARILAVCDPD
jgi:hypothetical protein